MKTLAYLFADHHAGGGYPLRGIEDSEFSLKQIIDMAINDKVPWLISLGDTVDAAKSHADAPIPLRNELRKVVEAGGQVGFIDGNHDKRRVPWLLDPLFYHLDCSVIELGDHRWMGLDYRNREELLEELSDLPNHVHGLFMHQGWGELMKFEGTSQCSIRDIPSPVRMVASGDYHGGFMLHSGTGSDNQKVLFVNPGSTSVQDITEPGEKFILAIVDDENEPFRMVRLKTRRLLRYNVMSDKALEQTLSTIMTSISDAIDLAGEDGLPENMRRPLVHVTYSSGVNSLTRRLEKIVGNAAHLFWTEVREEVVGRPSRVVVEGSLGTAFSPMMLLDTEIDPNDPDDKNAKEANDLARKLYDAKDKAEVTSMVRSWLAEKTAE